jgi:hypothetical protein
LATATQLSKTKKAMTLISFMVAASINVPQKRIRIGIQHLMLGEFAHPNYVPPKFHFFVFVEKIN